MARFHGVVGYGESAENPAGSGVWEDTITVRTYSGDVVRNTRQLQEREQVLDDISVQNSISIVADPYAFEHFFNIRYVAWQGSNWKVTHVEVQRPRLILRLGGKYNGPTV